MYGFLSNFSQHELCIIKYLENMNLCNFIRPFYSRKLFQCLGEIMAETVGKIKR